MHKAKYLICVLRQEWFIFSGSELVRKEKDFFQEFGSPKGRLAKKMDKPLFTLFVHSRYTGCLFSVTCFGTN